MRELPSVSTAIVVLLVVVAVGTFVTSVPAGGAVLQVADSDTTTESATATSTPTPTAEPTATDTATASPEPSSTETQTATAPPSDGAQPALADSDVVTEQWDDNLQVLVMNESAVDHDRVQSLEVRGADMTDELSVHDENIVGQGTIDKPVTIEVVVTYTDGTSEVIYEEQFD